MICSRWTDIDTKILDTIETSLGSEKNIEYWQQISIVDLFL